MKDIKINKATFWGLAFLIVSCALVVMIVMRVTRSIAYQTNVNQHVENAGKAATVEIAIEELEAALSAADEYGMTTGRAVILEESNAIDFYYKNLEGFLERLKSFDAETNPDIYQVEFNALQERMKKNMAPYGISFKSKVALTIYKILWLLEVIIIIGLSRCGNEDEYYTIRLSNFVEEVNS